jgi:two-component sensor histidine kinase
MFSSRDFSRAAASWRADLPPPVSVLLAGLALTLLAFVLALSQERQRDHVLFDAEVTKFMAGVRQSLSSSEVLMHSGAGLMSAHDDMATEGWRLFVDGDDFRTRFPGFQGMAYLRVRGGQYHGRHSRNEPPKLELALVEPHGAYSLSELTGGSAGETAMAKARDLNGAVRSRRVMLPVPGRGKQKQAGVVIYLPVFRRQEGTEGQKTAEVAGYVAMPFALPVLMTGLMQQRFQEVKEHLRVEIFDGRVTDDANLLFDSAAEAGYAPPARPRVSAQLLVDRFGTEWSYRFSSLPAYDRALGSYFAETVLAGGLVVSGLVTWLCSQLNARSRLAQEADRNSAFLQAELMHRVRNTLAVVQSIANRSLDGVTADEGREQFANRLSALARVHALLTENAGYGTPIGELMRSELAPMMHRAHALGPDIPLGPQVAQCLALVVHELASDAVRRGVHRINVDWRAAEDPEPTAVVTWREIGATDPQEGGLAQQILEHGLAVVRRDQQSGDQVEVVFAVPLV